jgi:hypothetical protein
MLSLGKQQPSMLDLAAARLDLAALLHVSPRTEKS